MSTNTKDEERSSRRFKLDLFFKVTDLASGKVQLGKVSDVSTSGFCIYPGAELEAGGIVRIENAFNKPIDGFQAIGKVAWQRRNQMGLACGIQILELDDRGRQTLEKLDVSVTTPRAFLKIILAVGVPLVPFVAFTLAFLFPRNFSWTFAGLVTFLILERLWETFFTSKESKATASSEDWTISAVSFYYLLAYYLTAAEFFLIPRDILLPFSVLGFVLMVSSFILRWWGMKTLGDQWAVHATDATKLQSERRLITTGPYNLCRHPIYLAVIMELLSLPLMANAWGTLFFVAMVNIPLQILRSKLEERKAFEIFGLEYLEYKKKTPGYIPFSR